MTKQETERPPATAGPVMIDVKIVAGLLGCSSRHVARMQDAGQMPPPVKLGRLTKWNRKVIEEWIEKGCPTVRRHGAAG